MQHPILKQSPLFKVIHQEIICKKYVNKAWILLITHFSFLFDFPSLSFLNMFLRDQLFSNRDHFVSVLELLSYDSFPSLLPPPESLCFHPGLKYPFTSCPYSFYACSFIAQSLNSTPTPTAIAIPAVSAFSAAPTYTGIANGAASTTGTPTAGAASSAATGHSYLPYCYSCFTYYNHLSYFWSYFFYFCSASTVNTGSTGTSGNFLDSKGKCLYSIVNFLSPE